ncbi:hypothetical protein GCM10026982_42690 [Nocardiopsis aegyptia]
MRLLQQVVGGSMPGQGEQGEQDQVPVGVTGEGLLRWVGHRRSSGSFRPTLERSGGPHPRNGDTRAFGRKVPLCRLCSSGGGGPAAGPAAGSVPPGAGRRAEVGREAGLGGPSGV